MKTILVPTDFSTAARNAAEYAVHLAKEIRANVILLHVYHVPIPISEMELVSVNPEDLQKENEALLQSELELLSKNAGVEVTCRIKTGFAMDEIVEEGNKASLIVMGMKGAGKLSEVLMGSITTATLRQANTPVLVIPEGVKYKHPKKIVLACDSDAQTDVHALDVLKALMKEFGSKIYVVNVKQKGEYVSMEKAAAELNLESKLNDVEHIYYFPEKEDLIDGINQFVQEQKADMVAIIPHRYKLMERLFHKSISKKMAFHSGVPLLALPDLHQVKPGGFSEDRN